MPPSDAHDAGMTTSTPSPNPRPDFEVIPPRKGAGITWNTTHTHAGPRPPKEKS